ncbi:beta-galactosidase [Skermania sp. ID1734]|uniref:beta-galactosidase n=1 Tax=Skermania sp. ID1734 TaxID=2597516 RepID=UPI001C8F8E17|nr:beta-galactosidase [Skermania sp. ID1734]
MGIRRQSKSAAQHGDSSRRRFGVKLLGAAAFVSVLLATAVLTGLPDSRGDVRGGTYGFVSVDALMNSSDAEINAEMDAMVAMGASWVRVGLHWNRIEAVPGVFDWGVTDRIVAAAKRHNLNVLGLLGGGAPLWAATPTPVSFMEAPPQDPRQFAAFALAAATHYVSSVATWEIWNEPNNPIFFPPAPNVAAYAAMLRAAYAAIHSVSGNVTVLSGGLAPEPAGKVIPPTQFVSQLYAAGAGGSFDGLSLHPYTFPFPIDSDPNGGWSSIAEAHQVMIDHGDGGKKIWLTEFGAPTGTSPVSVSEQAQANILVDAIHRAESMSYVGPLFVYTIRDTGVDPSNPEDNFGVLRHDFTRKAAYQALAGTR